MNAHSYFVAMQDFGRRGLEAVVQPELTRREIVSRIASGEYRDIAFIHYVHFHGHGSYVQDVTEELQNEARAVALQAAE